MLVNRMYQLMDDYVVAKSLRQSHELDIETDRIPVTTAPPSGFLVSARDFCISEAQLSSELHRAVWEVGSREGAKPCDLR